ncbi:hypothetical protein AA103196_2862 [Ameyamaea chiangmaiensis NBRC 103196]|nr:hypothetical protein AA103196_2862 [Ameyamaea chiangmaiensis NBRC 103196]
MQVDGYAGFEALRDGADPTVRLAACWSHMRHKFYDLHKTGSPLATEALSRVAALYAIEAEIRGQPPPARKAVRQDRARPLVKALHFWLSHHHGLLPARRRLAEAMRYALNRWHDLIRFLDDGRIDVDTNPVERAICPIALGRKNALFAGSEGGADPVGGRRLPRRNRETQRHRTVHMAARHPRKYDFRASCRTTRGFTAAQTNRAELICMCFADVVRVWPQLTARSRISWADPCGDSIELTIIGGPFRCAQETLFPRENICVRTDPLHIFP